jgi:YfiH family protein
VPRVLFTDRVGVRPGPADQQRDAGPALVGASSGPFARLNLGDAVGDAPDAVEANRRSVSAALGTPVVWMRQVHGARVAVVSGPAAESVPDVDALVTAEPWVGLGVLVADCVPVVLAGPGAVGVAHAGRRGLVAGVLPAALDALGRLGAPPDSVDVWLGPAICGRCYEVPAGMQAEVETAAPGSSCSTASGTPGLDLRAGLAAQAQLAGVRGVRVDRSCTAESPSLFSFRRKAVTGRMAGLVRL